MGTNLLAYGQQGVPEAVIDAHDELRAALAKASAEQQLAKVDANTRYLNTTLADLKKREQQWRQVASSEQANSTKKQQLNNEFNHMQRQISSLQQDVQQVEQQRNAIVLG